MSKRGSLSGNTPVADNANNVTLTGTQTITGLKTFTKKTKFNSDVISDGFFIGDGSQLTNLPGGGGGGADKLNYPVAQGAQTMQAMTVNGLANFNADVSFNNINSPPHCAIPPTNANDLCNKAYVDSQAPLTAYQLFCNYSETFSTPTNTYKLLSSAEVFTPATVPFTISTIGSQLLASFYNSVANLKLPSIIPPGNWVFNAYANVSALNDQSHLGLSYNLIGVDSVGAETILFTSASSTLITVVSPSIANYAMTITVPSTNISTYTYIGIKIYLNSNVATTRSGNIYFQNTSFYTNLLTSFSVLSPNEMLQNNNTWTGSNTFSQPISGSITSANALTTARTIGGVSFDGTANINLPGVNLTGNQNTSGNATTASKLFSSKLIGGVAFDGSADISLPGVNLPGTQNTSGNAATATNVAYSGLTGTPPTWNQSTTGSAKYAQVNDAITGSFVPLFVDSSGTGEKTYHSDASLLYNTATNTMSGGFNIDGNAATATILQTTRAIGGVLFNGSASINLPGVNLSGTQNTSGAAAKVTMSNFDPLLGAYRFSLVGNINGDQAVYGSPFSYDTTTATLQSVNISGSASTAQLTNITTPATYPTNYLVMSTTTGGVSTLLTATSCVYNASTNVASISITGTSGSVTVQNTDGYTPGTVYYPLMSPGQAGGKLVFFDNTTTPLSYVASTSTLSAAYFSGFVTGLTNSYVPPATNDILGFKEVISTTVCPATANTVANTILVHGTNLTNCPAGRWLYEFGYAETGGNTCYMSLSSSSTALDTGVLASTASGSSIVYGRASCIIGFVNNTSTLYILLRSATAQAWTNIFVTRTRIN